MKIQPSRFIISPAVKAMALACVAVFMFAIVATGGCSQSATNPGPSPSATPRVSPSPTGSPTASPSPTPTANDFVVMNYPSVPPTTDPTFGVVQGYMQLSPAPSASPIPSGSPTPTPTPQPTVSSGIITVHCNQNITFSNLDRTSSHTASLLGPAAGPSWPPFYQNANNTTPSVILTPITAPDFSSGNLIPAASSVVYSTGTTPGSFLFGDYYEYNPIFAGNPQMRTVITILCP